MPQPGESKAKRGRWKATQSTPNLRASKRNRCLQIRKTSPRLSFRPRNSPLPNALNDLGTTEARESNFPLALTHFHEAEQWQPALPGLMRNIGLAADRVQD